MPKEAEGVVVSSNSLDVSEPGVSAAYEVDMALEGVKFPKDSYEDGNAMDLTLGGN